MVGFVIPQPNPKEAVMGKRQEVMQREMELKGYSARTIKSYVGHMKRYTLYLGRSPVGSSPIFS